MGNRYHLSAHKCTSIYCGTMLVDQNIKAFFKDKSIWKRLFGQMLIPEEQEKHQELPREITLDDQTRSELNTLYYKGFINSSYPENNIREKGLYKQIRHYYIEINKDINPLKTQTQSSPRVHINTLHFYLFPDDILLFSFDIIQDGLSYDDITRINFQLRAPENYINIRTDGNVQVSVSEDFLRILQPLIVIYNRTHADLIPLNDYQAESVKQYPKLLDRGNKLKLYIYTHLQQVELLGEDYTLDHLLFEIGSCCKIGCTQDAHDLNKPSEAYFHELIRNNEISCFDNWKALALTDTFTVIFKSYQEHHYNNWKNIYFDYIYINVLFIKSFLITMNDKYKQRNISTELEDEFIIFDKIFNFNKISYNFLPQLIYDKIRFGLEIDNELRVLNEKIKLFSEKIDRMQEKRVNGLLFVLAILAVFSAVNDGMNLLSEISPITKNSLSYQKITGWIMGIILLTGLCFWLFKRKNKMKN